MRRAVRCGEKRSSALAAAALLALAVCVSSRAAAPDAPAMQPAEWRSFDLLVPLQNLPRTYSCDDLWYKFRDLLLKLGARAYMTITPYHCGFVGGGPATSPSVELKFQLPRTLSGDARRYAQLSVVDETVRVAPGSPASLHDDDCELIRQLRGTLFSALPVRVTAANFSCAASRPSFALNVQAELAAGRQAAAPPPQTR